MAAPVYTPTAQRAAASRMADFATQLSRACGEDLSQYGDLWQWSVGNPTEFWPALWRYCDVRSSRKWQQVLQHPQRMPGARWFTGARLNFAENLLQHRGPQPAIIFRDESGNRRELSRDELWQQAASVAAGLRAAGVREGDRVAAYMPNIPETVVVMLAASSIGATFSSCSPDFGVNGVLDRFGQIAPKVLFSVDGYRYNGKRISLLPRLAELLSALPAVEQVVLVPFLDPDPDVSALPVTSLLADFVTPASDIDFAQLPFDHPLYIMYSSGTTGTPKCIVHGAGGTLLQHLKELVLHTDVTPADRVFYFTTCGWMMWNWLASTLAAGATVVLYDGSPFAPDPEVLWRMADEERISVFGTSAKYLAALEKAGVKPGTRFDLASLRCILSTGSPLTEESYDYVYADIKPDLQLSSISGGTDIISCFALGNPLLPVYRGELQCRGLGMAVDIYDETGAPLRGEKGELVCTKPFPSMPLGFWNDIDDDRYREAYFNRFDNTWCHGDYALLTEHDGLIIYGRSDAVLNPGGVRIGTAEIYRQVEQLDEVIESIAAGQDWHGDQRIILFVRLRDGVELDDELRQRIRSQIRNNTTPRHVPAKIIAVADIPRTISGKIVELAVRNVIHGRAVQNTDAMANPEALQYFRDLPALDED
ncbi:MAG: acetoacetate--CoA ligase [Gammaproteobacteria bacterium]|nr:acetoacetate--CoA ligase [Gammaproteobacteria bacterium]NNF61610.1 acetoacetate--CoA ligase [Gammaproteobacteria bacterium]